MHLDALGWEQATKGDTATSEYWQFAPWETTLDLTSIASQQGNDDEAVSPGLRTPPSAHERRRTSTQRLARDSHPSTTNGSPGPSPANSFQLQQQPVLPLSQHTDLALPTDGGHLRRLTGTIQQQVQITPHPCCSQPQDPLCRPQSQPETLPRVVGYDQTQSSRTEPQAAGKLPYNNPNLHQRLKKRSQEDEEQPASSSQLQHSAAAPQPKTGTMLHIGDDSIQLQQAVGDIQEQRSKHGLAEPQAIILAATPGHQSNPFAPVAQQSQAHQIPLSSSQSQRPFRQDSAATTPARLHTSTGLVSEPPSAFWQYTKAAASTPTAQQAATYFSSPTSNAIMPGKMIVQQQLPQASAGAIHTFTPCTFFHLLLASLGGLHVHVAQVTGVIIICAGSHNYLQQCSTCVSLTYANCMILCLLV